MLVPFKRRWHVPGYKTATDAFSTFQFARPPSAVSAWSPGRPRRRRAQAGPLVEMLARVVVLAVVGIVAYIASVIAFVRSTGTS